MIKLRVTNLFVLEVCFNDLPFVFVLNGFYPENFNYNEFF